MEMKLELIAVPVTDVDRAKAFYADQAGFNVDHDHTLSDEVRFVQLTPPGSACSIAFGKGITDVEPGKAARITLVVDDIDAARERLAANGVDITEVLDMPWGARHAHFTDLDGNPWDLQRPSRG
jgi:catechol 2,3-dioxygenase-like lactoylglutathione lyase family enzyme